MTTVAAEPADASAKKSRSPKPAPAKGQLKGQELAERSFARKMILPAFVLAN